MPEASHDSDTTARSNAVRWFGRLQLLRLLGKSERTMAWRVAEPRRGQEWMLVLPRQPPPDAEALEHWQHATRRAARLNHPQLATPVETGVQDGWPFVAYELHDSATLAERLTPQGLPGPMHPRWRCSCCAAWPMRTRPGWLTTIRSRT